MVYWVARHAYSALIGQIKRCGATPFAWRSKVAASFSVSARESARGCESTRSRAGARFWKSSHRYWIENLSALWRHVADQSNDGGNVHEHLITICPYWRTVLAGNMHKRYNVLIKIGKKTVSHHSDSFECTKSYMSYPQL